MRHAWIASFGLVVACGGGGDVPGDGAPLDSDPGADGPPAGNTVNGATDEGPFVMTTGLVKVQSFATTMRLLNEPVGCGFDNGQCSSTLRALELIVTNDSAMYTPAPATVPFEGLNQSAGPEIGGQVYKFNPDCQPVAVGAFATPGSGNVTITAADATHLAGTVDFELDNNTPQVSYPVTGSFDATICP